MTYDISTVHLTHISKHDVLWSGAAIYNIRNFKLLVNWFINTCFNREICVYRCSM